MIFPTNFVIGAVVGAVSTYIFKDDTSKKWLRDTSAKVKSRACAFTTKSQKEEVSEATVQAGEVITPEKNTTADTETTKPKNA